MTLLSPQLLWLLFLVPIVWLVPRRVEDVRHGLLRTAVILFLVFGLARPVWWIEDTTEHQVLVWDRSASVETNVADDARRAVAEWLRAVSSQAHVELIELGDADLPPIDSKLEARVQRHRALTDGTDLGAALAIANRAIPEGGRGAVTVISDGLATARDWGQATQALVSRGVPVHTVTLPGRGADVRPIGLSARGELRVGQTARIEVRVAATNAVVDIALSSGEQSLGTVEGVAVDGTGTAVVAFEPDAPGFLELTATVAMASGTDSDPDNNAWSETFAVQEPLSVLYVGERAQGGAGRLEKLLGVGFRIEDSAVLADAPLPPASYDLILIDDRSADSLPESTQAEFVRSVSDLGVGLVMSGGGASFGPGGYHESTIARSLPVEFVQKEEKRDPSTTLVVIIDTSGSMGGNRVQLAKEVARLAIRRLLPHDKVGIVEFFGAKRWAAPIQPASNAIDIQRALNRLDAGGGTVILPAIEESFYAMQNTQTRYKHCLVLTDGGVETGAFEALLRRMADKGMNVSTVLVGPDTHSEFLVNLSNWGKGRFYSVPNRFNLPEVLLKQPNTSRIPAYRPGVHQVRGRGGPGWWGDVDRTKIPALAGYVETRPRKGAEVLIETTNSAHPILATWRYGLGRVTTFMTEPTGPGTEPWKEWSGYGPMLARVLTRTAADSRAGFDFTIERVDQIVTVRADRRVRSAIRPAAERMTESQSGGAPKRTPLEFRRRADGVFTSTFVTAPDEEVRIHARTEGQPRSITRLVSSSYDDLAPEANVDPSRALDLAQLAAATSGQQVEIRSLSSFAPPVGGASDPRALLDLWPWCFVLALLGYLGDLAYRRRPSGVIV